MTTIPLQPRAVALRPLALPAEHGGWGFLLEPIVLALLVAPSWSGVLLGIAALFAFLARHPLKLALQDAVRGKSHPRTPHCWRLAANYLFCATLSLIAAVMMSRADLLIPFALAAPLGLTQLLFDARNRSRELVPELSGAAAMSSVAAAIAIAGSLELWPAFGLAGIVVARSLPAILYVRAMLHRTPAGLVILIHATAPALVALYAAPLAVVAMMILLARAVWGLARPAPPAKTIGWREIVFGAVTVALVATGYAA